MLASVARSGPWRLVTGIRNFRSVLKEQANFGNSLNFEGFVRKSFVPSRQRAYCSMADNGSASNGQAAGNDAQQPKTEKQLKKEAKKNAKMAKFNEKMAKMQEGGADVS